MSCKLDFAGSTGNDTGKEKEHESCACPHKSTALFADAEGSQIQASGDGRGLVLVIDETVDSSNIFIELGFTPVRYSHWSINTGSTNEIGAQLKAYRYKLVWVDFPRLGNKTRPYAHMTCLVNWANLCLQLGIPFVIFGSFGKKWNDPQLIAAIDSKTLQKRHHRLCHFGIKADESMAGPSSGCFITASTVPYF